MMSAMIELLVIGAIAVLVVVCLVQFIGMQFVHLAPSNPILAGGVWLPAFCLSCRINKCDISQDRLRGFDLNFAKRTCTPGQMMLSYR